MVLKLRTESKTETITNENPAFDDSEYRNSDFSISYVPLSRTQEQALINKHTKFSRRQQRDKVDTAMVDIERFCKTVKAWKGVCDNDGKEIPCNEENKKTIAELEPIFSGLVMVAIYGRGFIGELENEGEGEGREDAEIKN